MRKSRMYFFSGTYGRYNLCIRKSDLHHIRRTCHSLFLATRTALTGGAGVYRSHLADIRHLRVDSSGRTKNPATNCPRKLRCIWEKHWNGVIFIIICITCRNCFKHICVFRSSFIRQETFYIEILRNMNDEWIDPAISSPPPPTTNNIEWNSSRTRMWWYMIYCMEEKKWWRREWKMEEWNEKDWRRRRRK